MNQPQIIDKNQFQRTQSSLTTLSHMVAISGKQDSQESIEVLKIINAVKKNNPKAAEHLYEAYGKLQKHLEDIKRFGKNIEFRQVNKLKEVLHLCAINNILSGTTKEKRAVLEKRVKLLLKKLRKCFDEQIKEEKRLLKKKQPEGKFWSSLINSNKQSDFDNDGLKLKSVSQQEEELYNKIINSIKHLLPPGTRTYLPSPYTSENVSKLLIRYLALLELEFEYLFKIQLDVDVKESNMEKNLESAKNVFDAKARKIITQLEKNYFGQISKDIILNQNLAKDSEKSLITVEDIMKEKIELDKKYDEILEKSRGNKKDVKVSSIIPDYQPVIYIKPEWKDMFEGKDVLKIRAKIVQEISRLNDELELLRISRKISSRTKKLDIGKEIEKQIGDFDTKRSYAAKLNLDISNLRKEIKHIDGCIEKITKEKTDLTSEEKEFLKDPKKMLKPTIKKVYMAIEQIKSKMKDDPSLILDEKTLMQLDGFREELKKMLPPPKSWELLIKDYGEELEILKHYKDTTSKDLGPKYKKRYSYLQKKHKLSKERLGIMLLKLVEKVVTTGAAIR